MIQKTHREYRYGIGFYAPGTADPPRPCIPLFLHSPVDAQREIFTWGLVDSGADSALFGAEMALYLGLDLRSGVFRRTSGLGGSVDCWYHAIDLTAFQLRFRADVAFTETWDHEFGLLGLNDLFSVFDIGISRADQMVLAEPVAASR